MIFAGSIAMMLAAAIVFPILWFVPAPYGRHTRAGFGPRVNARWAWLVMESPSVWLFAYVFLSSPEPHAPAVWLLAALFLLHYVQRTAVFPSLMKNPGKKPLLVAALAFLFNVCNSTLNAHGLLELDAGGAPEVTSPRVIGGALLFLAGFALNVHSDAVLRNLRKAGGPRYLVPSGGAFRYVTSPNYLGEILEWTGFAVAAGTLPAIAFAVFTVANLLPRARTHHAWYRVQFADYPAQRRILVPGLFGSSRSETPRAGIAVASKGRPGQGAPMPLDPARFPRAAEYVSALPQGLESFAACGARSVLFEPLVRNYSHLASEPTLPEQVATLLSGSLSGRREVPEVVFQTASLVIRDRAFEDDAAFHRWIFTRSRETFDGPLLKNLMKLVSPSLTVLGAAKRWGAFHTGSEVVVGSMEIVNGRSETAVELRYPEGLFSRTFLESVDQSFLAAIMAARAKDPRVELKAVEAGRAIFILSWAR